MRHYGAATAGSVASGASFLSAEQPGNGDVKNIRKGVQLNVGYGSLLALQEGERRDAQIDAPQLKLRQQLNLLHAQGFSGLGHASANNVPISQRKLSLFHPYHPLATCNYM